MSELGDGQGSVGQKNNTTLWIVGGLAVVCLCAVVAGAVILFGVAGFALFGVSAPMVMSTPVLIVTSAPIQAATTSPQQKGAPTGGPAGQTVDVPDQGRQHVPDGTDVVYNSNPPTSGPHYATPLPAGFYTESVPDGYVVHSMEHGYVVMWYDCETLSDADCQALQDDIQGVIKNSKQTKLIGIPHSGMDHPLALTSWTRLAYLDEFDANFVTDFINANILQAPEPSAP